MANSDRLPSVLELTSKQHGLEKRKGYDFWRNTLNRAKFVVAPMVDQSELAWRLLSRRYGAELCYTPMLHSSVFIRDSNYRKEGLASCKEDRPLIVQFCGNDPEVLLKAAKYAEAHVDGVDINLGCPQAIARRGHYGAFLQEEWDLLHKIVSLCASELKVPVTAKIRVFEDIDKTVRYAQMLEKAGVQLLTVHGRTIEQKGVKTGLASWTHIKAVREKVKIPMFANGNIQYLPDVYRCIEETGVDGVMTAEGNLHNPGLFDGKEHKMWDMAKEYLELVEKYPCPLSYVRGHIFKLCHHAVQVHKNVRDTLANSKSLDDIKHGVALLQECSKEDCEKYELNPTNLDNTLPHPYWICQPYVRPSEKDKTETKSHRAETKNQELESLKRALSIENVVDEEVLQELSKNKLKKLKRNHRKVFIAKSKEEKFPKCGCGNPKGLRCVFECCKQCCREKAFRENLDCPGHKILVKSRTEWTDQRKKEIETLVNSSSEENSLDKDVNNSKSSNCETVMDTDVSNPVNDDLKLDNKDVAKIICDRDHQCDSGIVVDNHNSVKC